MQWPIGFAWARRWGGTALLATAAMAQTTNTPPVTLHVYTDLLQIPVLVLNDWRQPMVGLDPKQFRLSVDSGPMFQPPYVRREGDDPLALTVLIGDGALGAKAEARLATAVGTLASPSLTGRDLVVLEALHPCGATRTEPFPVTTVDALTRKMAAVLNARDAVKVSQACSEPQPLWDMMVEACERLEQQRGRRVLLVVTNGADHGSHVPWRELRRIATAHSVAIFAVSTPPRQMSHGLLAPSPPDSRMPPEANPLVALCELTGGVLTWSDADDLQTSIAGVLRMVRERYILEFERPRRMEMGAHDLEVKVSKPHALVRPAGISFPNVEAAERDATHLGTAETTRAPEPGTRRVLNGVPQ